MNSLWCTFIDSWPDNGSLNITVGWYGPSLSGSEDQHNHFQIFVLKSINKETNNNRPIVNTTSIFLYLTLNNKNNYKTLNKKYGGKFCRSTRHTDTYPGYVLFCQTRIYKKKTPMTPRVLESHLKGSITIRSEHLTRAITGPTRFFLSNLFTWNDVHWPAYTSSFQ